MQSTFVRIVLVLFVIAAGAAFVYRSRTAPVTDTLSGSAATTTDEGTFVIEPLGTTSVPATPAVRATKKTFPRDPVLSRAIAARVSVTPDAFASMKKQIEELQVSLRENPDAYTEWIRLGIAWKSIGDYDAARASWAYAEKQWPEEYVAHNNLAGLYRYQLKDFPAAEGEYRFLVANFPNDQTPYLNLSQLYRHEYSAKKSEADDVLLEGLVALPGHPDILIELAQMKKSEGDISAARTYFTQAIASLNAQNDTKRAAMVQAELDTLK